MKWRVEESGGADEGRQPKNSAPPAPHEYADKCVTSVPERLELYGKAAPNRRPSDAEPRKTPKILQEGGGEVLGRNPGRSSASPRALPTPPFWGYLKSEKSVVLTHFSDDFQLFESHKML